MMWVVALLLAVAVSQILAQDGSDWIAAYDRQVGELAAQHPELRVFDGSSQRGQRREFPCEPLRPSERRAESVHELTPGDIAAVGALGDSVTAGFGARATSLIDLTVEARGASWSIGGDDDVSTLPNFFKVYNADLSGFSTGNGNVGLGYGDASISGAVSPGMLSQAETLASNMESAMGAEAFANEWKLVTVWIGGNDICSRGTSQEEYVAGIEAALSGRSTHCVFAWCRPRTLGDGSRGLPTWHLRARGARKVRCDRLRCCGAALVHKLRSYQQRRPQLPRAGLLPLRSQRDGVCGTRDLEQPVSTCRREAAVVFGW
jgi:hypothetical protein